MECGAGSFVSDWRTRPMTAMWLSTKASAQQACDPDGNWETVTQELGPPLTLSDAELATIGIFTAIRREAPSFLAIRLKVEDGEITEAGHIVCTARNLSNSRTPSGKLFDEQRQVTLARGSSTASACRTKIT